MQNNLKQAQVFTPSWATNEMIDMLKNSLLSDDETFFFEPSCGDGKMLVVILERCFEELLTKYNDDQCKALADTLYKFYAIELDKNLVPQARMRIYEWAISKIDREVTEFEAFMIARQLSVSIECKNFFDVMETSNISGSNKAKVVRKKINSSK